jgi:outer membrane protein assembly factor BamB
MRSGHSQVHTLALAALLLATCGQAMAEIDPLDWPNWRGPRQDSTSPETNLPSEWDMKGGEGSNLLWKKKELGGRSTPIVMNGKLYTIVRHLPETKLEAEKVVCADAATGDILWEHVFNVYLSDVPDTRLGWSCCVGNPETGRVFAQGVSGYFCCLDAKTGKVIWERSLHEEFGLLSTYGGRTNVPVLYDDTVIASAVVVGWGDTPDWGLMAKPAHRFMAFDQETGELRWLKGTRLIPTDTTYSTPTVVEIDGVDCLVFGSGDGQIWALQAGTGLPVWNYAFSQRGINTSPTVSPDGTVYVGHSEENLVSNTQGAVVALEKDGTQRWINYEIMAGKSSPLVIGDQLFVIDDRAKLFSFDTKTGKQTGKKALGTVQRSTPLYADGKLYIATNDGRWYIFAVDGKDLKQLHRMRTDEASDGSPIVSHGRIYIPLSEALYCIGNDESIAAAKKLGPTLKPIPPVRPPVLKDTSQQKIAHVQVVPYDAVLAPGKEQHYTVRLYDDKGNYVRNANPGECQFAVKIGKGSVTTDGTYVAPQGNAHECALVECKLGDVAGTARVRVIPPLPWKFDFEGVDDVPLTWVGGRVRYVIRKEEGNQFIAKPTELPTVPGGPTTKLGTRSQMWMGSSRMSNYTVTADVLLTLDSTGGHEASDSEDAPEFPIDEGLADARLPVAGLINGGYVFALFGPNQEARLFSWCTHDKRTQAAVKMDCEPGKWYSMKVKVVPGDKVTNVYGKVWERGTEEPKEWTLKFADESPIKNGAPGLLGDSQKSEFYVDNIEVTAND